MYRSIVVALCAALLSTACGAPEPAAPAAELGQTQGALSTLATYDSTRRAPRCASVGTGCDSGTLLRGRASLGPEQNAPNTLGGTCADGTSGAYHSDESLDQLEVLTVDGTSLAPGKQVRIRATVWAWSGGGSDKLDLYTTGNADAPSWTFLTTLTPAAAGAQTLTATYTLPSGPVQAVRGIFRYGGTAAPCGTGVYTDNDDLVFAVQSSTTPTVRLTAPAAGAVLQNTVNLTADFSGPTTPARVSFYEGTRWLGEDTTAPYAYAWNTRSVANGPYSLTARAVDAAGATLATSGAVQVQVRNDLAAPTVSLTAPAAGAVLRNTVVLTASASDDIGVTRVEFYRDGIYLGTAASASSPSYSWNTKTVANGPVALTARAYDAAGNVTTSGAVSATVDNDTATPTTTLTSPRDGTLTSGTLLLAASANDERGLTRLEFLFNGVVVCNLTLDGELSVSRTCSVSASTGSHTLQSRATDVGGNWATSAYVRITVDSTPPTVSITSPAAGASVSGTVTFAVSATDNQAVARTELFVDGWHVATRTSAPFDLSWDSRSVTNGSHTVQVYAYDTLGNRGQSALQSVMVANDLTPPTTSILSPVESQEVFSVMRITARADDAVGVVALEVFVDGVSIVGNSYPGNPSVTAEFLWDPAALSEGFHQIFSLARDAAGNVAVSPGLNFYVDRTPPQVAITSLVNGQQVTGLVTVEVMASDDRDIRKVELLVDGWDVTSTTQAPYQLHWDTLGYEDGIHQVRALAFDTAGNITRSQTLDIVVSNGAAPVVQLLRPGSGTVGGLVELEATASADVGIDRVDFWLDTQLLGTVTAPPYVLSWDSAGTVDGTYQLRAMAVSTTGKVTSSEPVSLTVANDAEPPMAFLRLYAQGSEVTGNEVSGQLVIEGSAFDASGISVLELYVDGQLVESPPYGASMLSHYWNTQAISDGPHTLELRAQDTYGKVTTVTRTVTVANDLGPPMVDLRLYDMDHVELTGSEVRGIIRVEGDAFDPSTVTALELYLDGQLLHAAPPEGTHWLHYYWGTGTVLDGPHTLELRARDPYGKVGSVTRSLVVANDQGPPMVDLRLRDSSTDQQYPGDEVYGVVDVEADVFDESPVTLTELYIDGELIVSVDGEWANDLRYFWDTQTVSEGAHTLEVRSYDSYGKVGIVTRNLVVANDQTPPDVYIHAPSEGMTVSGTVTVVVPAYDDVGITRIDLLVDGAPIMTTLSHHGDFPWDTRWQESGPHTLTARAYDATGKVGESAPVTVTVLNENVTGQAAYDDSLQAPGCTWVGTGCDSGVLLVGSGTEGFEPHAPNTLAGSCGDDTATGFHTASTIDRVWVDNPYGSLMTAGEWVGVQLNVFTTSPQDEIDVYSAADAANPTWTLVATLLPFHSGPQLLNASFQLPAGTLQAVRAVLRQGGTPEACAEGVIADHDDLFFAVQ